MKKSYNFALCYNRLARGKGKKVKFVLKTFFCVLAAFAWVWCRLVSGFNCFKAAEHRFEKTNNNKVGTFTLLDGNVYVNGIIIDEIIFSKGETNILFPSGGLVLKEKPSL